MGAFQNQGFLFKGIIKDYNILWPILESPCVGELPNAQPTSEGGRNLLMSSGDSSFGSESYTEWAKCKG